MSSSFVNPKKIKDYPLAIRLIFNSQKKTFGDHLKPTLYWGMIPRAFLLFSGLYKYFDRKSSTIDPVIRSLVMVHISHINWCDFCIDLNSLFLAQRSDSMDIVNELDNWRDSKILTDKQKAAICYAEEITHSEKKIKTSTKENLKKYFTPNEIVELAALIAYQNMSSKFNSALEVPAQGLCTIPPQRSQSEPVNADGLI